MTVVVQYLIELAERCEKANTGSRELDAEIAEALLIVDNCFTASIDAAMTLLPEGALWRVAHLLNIGTGELFERPKGEAETVFNAGVGVGEVPATWTSGRSFAAPALALCAAALRARASIKGEG